MYHRGYQRLHWYSVHLVNPMASLCRLSISVRPFVFFSFSWDWCCQRHCPYFPILWIFTYYDFETFWGAQTSFSYWCHLCVTSALRLCSAGFHHCPAVLQTLFIFLFFCKYSRKMKKGLVEFGANKGEGKSEVTNQMFGRLQHPNWHITLLRTHLFMLTSCQELNSITWYVC